MFTVKRYSETDKTAWNNFLQEAKNSTFLFHRDYVDYHSDRFNDHSAMIFSDNKLCALFIASEKGDVIQSHGGLSYGGLILEKNVRLNEVLRYFYHLLKYYSNDFSKIVYKCFPSYYCSVPAHEDLYALFLVDAKLIRRDTSSVYDRSNPRPYKERKKRSLKKTAGSLRIQQSPDPQNFWKSILEPNLEERFGVKPVHTLDEVNLLMSRFPENIKLFEVHSDELLGGTLIFETEKVAHAQYISASAAGKAAGALDFLFDRLIQDTYSIKRFFSMGISNENDGRKLNDGLMDWKEGFGTSMYALDFYSIDPKNFTLLSEYE
ncbi:MAG TPA: GNAT family N-acetyltransferase [Cyclobacteriaceae bacterium]